MGRSRNAYANKPYPRLVSEGARRGWRAWSPNPNPEARRTLTEAVVAARRQARRIRSTKHRAGTPRSVPPSSGEVRMNPGRLPASFGASSVLSRRR